MRSGRNPSTPIGRLAALLVAVSWAASGCDRAETDTEATWTVSPAPTVEIGEVEGEDEYLFQSIRDARFLPDGRIAVADAGQLVIRVYGPEGEFETEMGGRGDGPGEFGAIDGMWITSEGRIAAWDSDNLRISTFRPDGGLAGTHDVTPVDELPGGNLEVFLGSFGDDDVVLALLQFGARDEAEEGAVPDRWVLARFGPEGAFRELLGEIRGFRRVRGQPVPFTPIPRVAVGRDSLYVVDGYEAEVSVRDGSGEPVRMIGLPRAQGAEGASEDRWASLEAELRRRGDERWLQMLERLPRQERVPRVAGILIDARGLLWTKVYEPMDDALWLGGTLRPAPGGLWRVVRPDGGPVATIRMPEGVTPLEVRGDRLLGVARGALDVERIAVHRLER